MTNFKDFFLTMAEMQATSTLTMIDAFSKFSGMESNIYTKSMKSFVEKSKENVEKAIKGEYYFSGNKM